MPVPACKSNENIYRDGSIRRLAAPSRMSGKEKEEEAQVFTVFDDQEIPYATLNSALGRLTKILDQPLAGKETFPAVKLKKEHIDFFVSLNLMIFY